VFCPLGAGGRLDPLPGGISNRTTNFLPKFPLLSPTNRPVANDRIARGLGRLRSILEIKTKKS
jgi:hypothetical protein